MSRLRDSAAFDDILLGFVEKLLITQSCSINDRAELCDRVETHLTQAGPGSVPTVVCYGPDPCVDHTRCEQFTRGVCRLATSPPAGHRCAWRESLDANPCGEPVTTPGSERCPRHALNTQAGHRGTPRNARCNCWCFSIDVPGGCGCECHGNGHARAPLPPGSAAPPMDVIGNLSAALAENGPAPYVQTLTRLSDAVEVVSDGPPTRTVSEILADPPRLTMSAPPGSAVAGAPCPKPAGEQETLATWAICPRCKDRVTTKLRDGRAVLVAHAAKGTSPRTHCRESGQAVKS